MKIKLNEIPDSGLELNEFLSEDQIQLDRNDIDIQFPVTIKCDVKKSENQIEVFAGVSINLKFVCSRCLKNISARIDKNFSFIYCIDTQSEVDLTEAIREELILSFPLRMFCNPTCKGLCSVCGADLNHSRCGCKPIDGALIRKIKGIEQLL